ncbi:hypothetical protein KSP39_PZI024376 [Platanthera zijinensis]|uniref:CHCH domain-containing protein n=1 Tax=Platanthera zijinensis TaxID=2320716 RepID=A0AAP0ASJ3_9ASPA
MVREKRAAESQARCSKEEVRRQGCRADREDDFLEKIIILLSERVATHLLTHSSLQSSPCRLFSDPSSVVPSGLFSTSSVANYSVGPSGSISFVDRSQVGAAFSDRCNSLSGRAIVTFNYLQPPGSLISSVHRPLFCHRGARLARLRGCAAGLPSGRLTSGGPPARPLLLSRCREAGWLEALQFNLLSHELPAALHLEFWIVHRISSPQVLIAQFPLTSFAPAMSGGMESTSPRPECAKQALDLLNCAAEPDFDQEKCIRFLAALRNCIQDKEEFKPFTKMQTPESQSTLKSGPRLPAFCSVPRLYQQPSPNQGL